MFYWQKLAAHFKMAILETGEAKKKSPLVQLLRPYVTDKRKWSVLVNLEILYCFMFYDDTF